MFARACALVLLCSLLFISCARCTGNVTKPESHAPLRTVAKHTQTHTHTQYTPNQNTKRRIYRPDTRSAAQLGDRNEQCVIDATLGAAEEPEGRVGVSVSGERRE